MELNELTLDEKIGQMLCFAFHGTKYNQQLKTLIEDLHIGNIVHFARNIENVEQVKILNQDMQKHAKIPLFISLDQEGGMVRRVEKEITYLPGAMCLSAGNKDHIYKINYETNCDLKSLGFDINYAPVADINNNPFNPVINSRSYADNPEVVAECVIKAFKGIQDALMLPTAKHFPGHGDTNVDSHLGLPVVDKTKEELMELELVPFKRAIAKGIDGIMVAHILYSQLDNKYPSSLSYNIITKLLKQELGFKGLITTDSLTMGAIWKKFSMKEIVLNAVNAGNDVIVFCGKADLNEQTEIVKTFKELVEAGEIPMTRVNESVTKILNLKKKYCIPTRDSLPDINQNYALNIMANSITKAFDNNNLLPIQDDDKVLIVFPKIKLATLVDNENNTYETLGKHLSYDEIIISDDENNLEKIVQIKDKYDKIIMATYNVKANDYQQQIYNILDKNKTIVVALRSPYDYHLLSGVSTYICTYDFTKESIKAVSEKLLNNDFNGKLPIKI